MSCVVFYLLRLIFGRYELLDLVVIFYALGRSWSWGDYSTRYVFEGRAPGNGLRDLYELYYRGYVMADFLGVTSVTYITLPLLLYRLIAYGGDILTISSSCVVAAIGVKDGDDLILASRRDDYLDYCAAR